MSVRCDELACSIAASQACKLKNLEKFANFVIVQLGTTGPLQQLEIASAPDQGLLPCKTETQRKRRTQAQSGSSCQCQTLITVPTGKACRDLAPCLLSLDENYYGGFHETLACSPVAGLMLSTVDALRC